jgi:hypothetical protein
MMSACKTPSSSTAAGARSVEAHNPLVWVRYKGDWRKGTIHCWYVHAGTWMAWLQHQSADPAVPWATCSVQRVCTLGAHDVLVLS